MQSFDRSKNQINKKESILKTSKRARFKANSRGIKVTVENVKIRNRDKISYTE